MTLLNQLREHQEGERQYQREARIVLHSLLHTSADRLEKLADAAEKLLAQLYPGWPDEAIREESYDGGEAFFALRAAVEEARK